MNNCVTDLPERDFMDEVWAVAVEWEVGSRVWTKTMNSVLVWHLDHRNAWMGRCIPFPSSLMEYSAIRDRIPREMPKTSS